MSVIEQHPATCFTQVPLSFYMHQPFKPRKDYQKRWPLCFEARNRESQVEETNVNTDTTKGEPIVPVLAIMLR